MADIEQITKIDLELAQQISAVNVSLGNILDAQKATNEHLKALNGKVADHERRLSDYGAFKKSVEESAQKKAKETAERASTIRSTIISILLPIATLVVLYVIQQLFHINLSAL